MASKLLKLVKIHPEVQIFCLNELKLDVTLAQKVCPVGFQIFHSDPCSDNFAYSAIIVRDDLKNQIKKTTFISWKYLENHENL